MTTKTYNITYRVIDRNPWAPADRQPAIGSEFVETIDAESAYEALDLIGGFSWAEYVTCEQVA